MNADDAEFWDRRYRDEGAIWGEAASPTAVRLAELLPAGARVLDVGFGYGRDLVHLARCGLCVSGVEAAAIGHEQARRRLTDPGQPAATLYHGRFETIELPTEAFDAVLAHRVAHLLTTTEAIREFAERVGHVLRPEGLLALAARDLRDLDPAQMVLVEPGVYEYRHRPGHRIRYWDDDAVDRLCSAGFERVSSQEVSEPETLARPVPCHLLLLVVRKRPRPLVPAPNLRL